MIDIISRELPCIYLRISNSCFLCFFGIGGLITLLWLVNLISLWYSLMHKDLYDIWFLGSYWLTRVARGDFATLVVTSQEPRGEWVNSSNLWSLPLI